MPAGGSLKYAIQFGLMTIGFAIAAAVAGFAVPGRLLLIGSAASFGWVGLAYAIGRPSLLMKQADGRQPWLAWLILWPYFLLARLSFGLYRLTTFRHPAAAEVRPGLWFARRLARPEFRALAVRPTAVLDLAAEFPRAAPAAVAYRSLPLLDGTVPTDDQLNDAIAWIDEHLREGSVLVHCLRPWPHGFDHRRVAAAARARHKRRSGDRRLNRAAEVVRDVTCPIGCIQAISLTDLVRLFDLFNQICRPSDDAR